MSAAWLAAARETGDTVGAVHGIAIAGLAMLALSGEAMLLADLETFWSAKAFWIEMGLVALLLANGLLMRQAERLAPTLPAKAVLALSARDDDTFVIVRAPIR